MTYEDMAVKITEVDARSRSNSHRIDELSSKYDAINRIATAVEVIATEQKYQTESINDVKSDITNLNTKVEAIESAPAKKTAAFVEKVWLSVATTSVGAVVGGIIAHFAL